MSTAFRRPRQSRRQRLHRGLILLVAVAVTVAGCSRSGHSGTSDKAQVTIWAAADTLPVIQLYQRTHPNAPVKVQTVDRTTFPAKDLLFNNTRKGWPDVIYLDMTLFAQVTDSAHDFPLDLTKYVSKKIRTNYTPGALDTCTIGGKLLCMRNDLTPNVLWYNKPLMTKFGYQVPTTGEQYEALGRRVAKEHPGYIIGALDGAGSLGAYFQANQCPASDVLSKNKVRIDLTAPACTRTAAMLDNMISNKSISPLDHSDPALAKIVNQDKLLMMFGPAWYGQYVFGGTAKDSWYKKAQGQLAAAPPLKWQGENATTGATGGGAWVVSRHAQNPKLAASIAIWLATSSEHAAIAPSLPAYVPSAKIWQKTLDKNKLYATNPYPVFKTAAPEIASSIGYVRYDINGAYTQTIIKAVQSKHTVASALLAFQKRLQELAKAQGYTVVG